MKAVIIVLHYYTSYNYNTDKLSIKPGQRRIDKILLLFLVSRYKQFLSVLLKLQ